MATREDLQPIASALDDGLREIADALQQGLDGIANAIQTSFTNGGDMNYVLGIAQMLEEQGSALSRIAKAAEQK